MGTGTSLVAKQYRLQQWAVQVRECQNRLADMTVQEWCAAHGLTKADYYYRLRRVRETCLEQSEVHEIVPLTPKAATYTADADSRTFSGKQDSLCITAVNFCIHATQDTSKELLSMVLGVIHNAQRCRYECFFEDMPCNRLYRLKAWN